MRRETVSGYLKAAGIPVRGRGAAPPSGRRWVRQIRPPRAWYPPTPRPPPGRAPRASPCAPYRDLVTEGLARGAECTLGRAAIQQGHRVVYREAHALLEELADATLDGTRTRCLADLPPYRR